MQPFTTQRIDLQKGDAVYMFSDGYIDQFGGPKGKKFKTGSLKNLLLSIQQQDFNEQLNTIDKQFSDWKGALSQVDDVVVIGFRVS